MFLTAYAVAHAILVAIASLALNHRLGARIWVVLYLPLMWCGFVMSVLVYWARQSYDRPKPGAIRLALGILVFLNLYMGALLFGAVKLGDLSGGDALNSYAPYILGVLYLGIGRDISGGPPSIGKLPVRNWLQGWGTAGPVNG